MRTLKRHEAVNLSIREMLELFRRCEQIADSITRGRAKGGKYGTAEALVRQTADFVSEVRRLQDRAAVSSVSSGAEHRQADT